MPQTHHGAFPRLLQNAQKSGKYPLSVEKVFPKILGTLLLVQNFTEYFKIR